MTGTAGRATPRVPPLWSAVAGAAFIAASAPLVALSGADAATATFFRCVIALPLLALMLLPGRGRRPATPLRDRMLAMAGGVLLGADLLLWAQAIGEVGVGVSTVIVNAQVILLPVLAFVVDGERPTRRFVLAVGPMLVGVALAGGAADSATGSAPLLGTVHASLAALCYAGYLFLLRRRPPTTGLVLPVFDVTVGAAVLALVLGGLWQGIDVTPTWSQLGWLAALAVTGQIAGWLLIAASLPRLSSRAGSTVLILPPVGVVLLAFVVLGQQPTWWQLAGCGLVVAAVVVAQDSREAVEEVSPAPVRSARGAGRPRRR